ncbi:MAG: outer membrane beta-barrel protein [Thiolinea sp.]
MKSNLLAGLITLALSSTAFAYDYSYTEEQQAGNGFESFYAGASMGMLGGDGGEVCEGIDLSCMSWKGYAGYRKSENFALEAGYHSLLDTRSSSTAADIDVSALSLSAMGITSIQGLDFMPGNKDLELFGKLGMAVWDSKVNHAAVVDGTDFLLGGGAQMKLNDNLGLRGEMEYIGGDVDSTNYTAGMTYSTF